MARIPATVRREVLARDRRCVASLLWPHVCATTFGSVHPATYTPRLELDHVREDPQAGETAPSRPEFLVPLCGYAHQTSHWATRNRPVLRAWLDMCNQTGTAPGHRAIQELRLLVVP